jgi:hypothetical protein
VPRRLAFDRTEFERVMTAQQGAITRAQALAYGMTDGAIRRRIEPGGQWQRLLPGVYLAVTGQATRDQRQVAALLYAGDHSVLTGVAALERLGIRVPVRDKLVVLVPAVRRHNVGVSYVTIWATTRMPARCLVDGAIRYALPERAASDAARELAAFSEIRAVVASAVQSRWCRVDRLADEARLGPRRGSTALRKVLAEVIAGARSAPEAELLTLIAASGLPAPLCNPMIYSGRVFIARPDLWWPAAGVAVEVDSKEWHLSPDDHENTLRRHARMSAHGIIVLHVTPRQIRAEPALLIAQIEATVRSGLTRPRLPLRTVQGA